MSRRILLVVHPRRADAVQIAAAVIDRLTGAGLEVAMVRDDVDHIDDSRLRGAVEVAEERAAQGCELVCVLGGDGTILRGTELARASDVPVLGVNLGHVGFLAEAERDHLEHVVERIVARDYSVEERLALQVDVFVDGEQVASTWALNEATIEKASRERMIELTLEIDDRPLSTWGCDGVILATPTGSTAYAFSAGGPVVWPTVEAILVVPLSAHALFARPMVLSPDSTAAVELLEANQGTGVLWCDGRRMVELPRGARVEARRADQPVRLARLTSAPFTSRLVAKFDLSIVGWRGAARDRLRG